MKMEYKKLWQINAEKLYNQGMEEKEIAERIGASEILISDYLSMLQPKQELETIVEQEKPQYSISSAKGKKDGWKGTIDSVVERGFTLYQMSIMTEKTEKRKRPPGPEPDRLEIKGDWREAMGKAIKKKRPKKGWPEPTKDSNDERRD